MGPVELAGASDQKSMGPQNKRGPAKTRANVAALDTLGPLELDEAPDQVPVGPFGDHGAPLETHFSFYIFPFFVR